MLAGDTTGTLNELELSSTNSPFLRTTKRKYSLNILTVAIVSHLTRRTLGKHIICLVSTVVCHRHQSPNTSLESTNKTPFSVLLSLPLPQRPRWGWLKYSPSSRYDLWIFNHHESVGLPENSVSHQPNSNDYEFAPKDNNVRLF